MSGTLQGLSGKDKAKVARLLQRIVETEHTIRKQRAQHQVNQKRNMIALCEPCEPCHSNCVSEHSECHLQAALADLHKTQGLAATSVDLQKDNARQDNQTIDCPLWTHCCFPRLWHPR
jgi:hypothetical protein